MTRSSRKWKYDPTIERLECKQLLAPAIHAGGVADIARVTSLVAPKPEARVFCPLGTGKGIRIITS